MTPNFYKFNEIIDDPRRESEAYAILRERIDRYRLAERLPIPPGYITIFLP